MLVVYKCRQHKTSTYGKWGMSGLSQKIWCPEKVILDQTQLKAGTEWKTESQTEFLNLILKFYFTIVDLLCKYKSEW